MGLGSMIQEILAVLKTLSVPRRHKVCYKGYVGHSGPKLDYFVEQGHLYIL